MADAEGFHDEGFLATFKSVKDLRVFAGKAVRRALEDSHATTDTSRDLILRSLQEAAHVMLHNLTEGERRDVEMGRVLHPTIDIAGGLAEYHKAYGPPKGEGRMCL